MLSLLLLSSFAGVIPFLGSSGEPAKEKVETNDSVFSPNSRENNRMGFLNALFQPLSGAVSGESSVLRTIHVVDHQSTSCSDEIAR